MHLLVNLYDRGAFDRCWCQFLPTVCLCDFSNTHVAFELCDVIAEYVICVV